MGMWQKLLSVAAGRRALSRENGHESREDAARYWQNCLADHHQLHIHERQGGGIASIISRKEYWPAAAANKRKRSDQQLQTKRRLRLGGSKGGKADRP